jgi:hypothetical protein
MSLYPHVLYMNILEKFGKILRASGCIHSKLLGKINFVYICSAQLLVYMRVKTEFKKLIKTKENSTKYRPQYLYVLFHTLYH